MGTTAPTGDLPLTSTASEWARAATALEVLIVYAGVLIYIWRWQITHPRLWIPLLALIVASHFLHRDTLRDLGLTVAGLHANAELLLPLVAAVYLPLTILGLATHRLTVLWPGERSWVYFASYGSWCVFQQYLAQSYFNNRLMRVIRNRHVSSAMVGLMFGAAHIPNPILMLATTLGGFVFAEVFARHRNLWPIVLAQTVGGFLIAVLAPAALIHNMRVGPGYFSYGSH
jgi:Type II CAAX prenyl endopeptidase Rce1-like